MTTGITVETDAAAVTYISPWLKVAFDLHRPVMTYLAVDSAGERRLSRNLLKSPVGCGSVVFDARDGCGTTNLPCEVSVTDRGVRYSQIQLGDSEIDALTFTVEPKAIKVDIDRDMLREEPAARVSPFRMMFDATVTPVSPLGRLREPGKFQFPVLLHFPDYGSLLAQLKDPGLSDVTWDFSLFRDLKSIRPGAVAAWEPKTPAYQEKMQKLGNRYMVVKPDMHIGPEQIQLALHQSRDAAAAGKQHMELTMEVTAIYPEPAVVNANPTFVGIQRAWLNIFGFRADLGCLANNSTGDTCQFCLYKYADQARYTPPLFDGFTALDLVRMSLDRYFDGFQGYQSQFQDVAPSTIIAAWDYATGKPDREWLQRRIGVLEQYAKRMIDMDVDGDGFCESENGSTDWWDCIPWNWKDAYSSALSYRAFRCLADLERRLGNEIKVQEYRDRADKIKTVYYKTFYNPATGVLAGWRLKDGTFGDAYFLFANGIAISYGLVDKEQANAILDRLQTKIKEVGFQNFQYGLPGNLIPFANPYGLRFQWYENGGVTGSMAYHYVQGLYAVGRTAEANAIFDKMLEGYRAGTFQNGIGNGGDWKEWDGSPCGYEGLLVDAFYPLTAFITGRLGRGVPIP